jgi:hypothetical protein
MLSSIDNPSGPSINRLESFRDALDELVARGERLSKPEGGQGAAVSLFAYGFGFGNPLSEIFGRSGEPVRDLLELPGEPTSTVPIQVLARKWPAYRQNVEDMATEMFGQTPMASGLTAARDRFRAELVDREVSHRILFILSDGEPTDATSDEITAIASQFHDQEILIISCFVTDEDLTEPRRLYGTTQPHWPDPAILMFNCASALPVGSSYEKYLREYGWTLGTGSRLFTQINQSDVLKEFMNVVLSPLEGGAANDTSKIEPEVRH